MVIDNFHVLRTLRPPDEADSPLSVDADAVLSGAVALQETIAIMKPSRVFFSAQGVREGYLYSLLPDREKARDPLLAGAALMADPAWSRDFARSASAALTKPVVRVDVPGMAVTY